MRIRTTAVLALVSGCDLFFPLKDFGSIDGPPLQCPTGYTTTSTGTYRLDTTAASWSSAEKRCRDDRGDATGSTHLVVISDFAEHDEVRALAASQRVHIGLSDQGEQGVFRWVSEEPNTFADQKMTFPWGVNEPNNGAGGGIEDCVNLQVDGTFNDILCSLAFGFVCECDVHAAVTP